MAVEIDIDLEQFEALLGAEAMEAAQDKMSRRWRDLMEPYVPKDMGPLREHVKVEGQEITYTEGYAVYVYNMDKDVNWTIKGTGPHWNELAKAEKLGDLAKYVGECILGVEE